nr:immunoglobulin heavy chain junction region [Mus musculus]MBK4188024.1 immunoglobulin heavy chain junction region [Mus musculus]MBK4188025.1 immunoglobulin heavy chain junction region [Mus musculus]MBK4188026.1 immunoglobulin heavy chain junction region [Mus musculus]MBK4188030.1 immunoglobulin heavy chain junction region [Mus musculus]
CARGDGSFAYW